jgi:1,3-propanediol dehydrogenase/alcohol dehydrogenase
VNQVYVFGSPSTVLYGAGCIEKVGERLAKYGLKRALIVTDDNLVQAGKVELLKGILASSQIDSCVYSGVNAETTNVHVDEGVDALRRNSCDVVIALGGGSPIDAAKGIAILATNPGDITNYEGRNIKIPHQRMMLVAIGTTAGTGSEVTRAAVITDVKRNVKMVIKDEMIRPDMAVCDPLLTVSMPPSVTAATGMDALAHAIEGSVGRETQPMSEIFGLAAMKLISHSLPRAWADGQDIAARSDMMLAELLAGFAFGISATCSGHGLARPFGAHFHVPHGMCNAFFLPIFMEFTIPACPEKFAKMADAMGEDTTGLTVWEAGMKAVESVRRLQKIIGIPTLVEYGIDVEEYRKSIPQMVKDGIASGSHRLNPRVPTEQELHKLYESLLN